MSLAVNQPYKNAKKGPNWSKSIIGLEVQSVTAQQKPAWKPKKAHAHHERDDTTATANPLLGN